MRGKIKIGNGEFVMAESKIKAAIKMANQPVAILKSDLLPDNALQFKEGKWGCVIAMLTAASKGSTAAFCEKTTACNGGKSGLGFKKFQLGTIEYFLSTGEIGPKEGEFYKKDPALAREYIINLPTIQSKKYLIFKPLSKLTEKETPDAIVFLVNADQLSALVTLANYDQPTQDNVQVKFGAGCAQAILYPVKENENESSKCTIGLTDPSARKCIDKELLSFSIPYKRYLEMEAQVEESFLTKETWLNLAKRI